MSYVYTKVLALQGVAKVGDHQCVALVRHFAGVPSHEHWSEGAKVVGNNSLEPGTAIATFVDGKYPNKPHGNHAAFYVGQASDGIYVLDQWASPNKPTVSQRLLYRRGRNPDGSYVSPSNNADAFSVIE